MEIMGDYMIQKSKCSGKIVDDTKKNNKAIKLNSSILSKIHHFHI